MTDSEPDVPPEDDSAGMPPMMPIPPICYSTFTDLPFSHCIDCERELLENPEADPQGEQAVPYQIQKTFVRRESVFEFALCAECGAKMRSRISRQTAANLQRFFQDALTEMPRCTREQVLGEELECLICHRPQRECHRYSMVSFLYGWGLLLQPCPMIICDHCEPQLEKLISAETRREWDRFVDEHFDSPPGVEQDSPSRFPVLV